MATENEEVNNKTTDPSNYSNANYNCDNSKNNHQRINSLNVKLKGNGNSGSDDNNTSDSHKFNGTTNSNDNHNEFMTIPSIENNKIAQRNVDNLKPAEKFHSEITDVIHSVSIISSTSVAAANGSSGVEPLYEDDFRNGSGGGSVVGIAKHSIINGQNTDYAISNNKHLNTNAHNDSKNSSNNSSINRNNNSNSNNNSLIHNNNSNNNNHNHQHIHHHQHHHHHKQTYQNHDPSSKNFYHAPPDRINMPPILASSGEDDDGLGPLPPKWEKAYTENGETYFIDHNTGTSHWLDPRLSKFQKKSLEDCMDDELPYGWEKIHDPQYGTYFIDHVNRRTQYENPVLEAKRRSERLRNGNGAPNVNINGSTSSAAGASNENELQSSTLKPNLFTKNPSELCGERITTTLLKSSRGLGFTIVGGDDNVEEFLQIKSIVTNGPAWLDGKLQTGDILVYVNDTCVLGFTHHEMVNVFQSILPGETVTLEVCRGYPLPFDPNDPNTEVVTTIAVDGLNSDPDKARILMDLNMDGNYNFLDMSDTPSVGTSGLQNNSFQKLKSGSLRSDISENYINESRRELSNSKPEILNISITKGPLGFGFTIADSAYGQKVKKILDRNCCKDLLEGDYLLAINNTSVMYMSHSAVVQVLKNCPRSEEAILKIQRGHLFNGNTNDKIPRLKRNGDAARFINPNAAMMNGSKEGTLGLYRSKTPTAELYSTQPKEVLPTRSKTPLVDTRSRAKTPSSELNAEEEVDSVLPNANRKHISADAKSNNSFPDQDSINNEVPYIDPFPKLVLNLSDRLANTTLNPDPQNHLYHTKEHGHQHNQHFDGQPNINNYEQNSISSGQDYYGGRAYTNSPNNSIYAVSANQSQLLLPIMAPVPTYHHDHCYCFECQDYGRHQQEYNLHIQQQQKQQLLQQEQQMQHSRYQYSHSTNTNGRMQKRINDYMIDRRNASFSPLEAHPQILSTQQLLLQPQQNAQQHQLLQEATYWSKADVSVQPVDFGYVLSEVTLERQSQGFGFRIVGGTEEGSQVTVGHIVPNGAADGDPRIATGDEILSIDGHNVVQSSHHRVVQLMGEAAQRGQVTMILRRKVQNPNTINMQQQQQQQQQHQSIHYPYDVVISRNENEGFGFVIISATNQYYGSTIGKLIPGSPADRCEDLKVGDRIIAVNRVDIAGMSHGDVVNLIKESGLHVRLTIGNPKDGQNPNIQTNLMATQTSNNSTLNDSYFERSNGGTNDGSGYQTK